MNREIKFRAWDKDKGISYVPVSINFSKDGHLNGVAVFVNGLSIEILGNNEMVWMQYTGLKDKNGKEIYEGDIVSYKTFHYGNEKAHKKEVKWDKWTSDDFGEPDCVGYFNLDSSMEVIGNIYENPELLEENK